MLIHFVTQQANEPSEDAVPGKSTKKQPAKAKNTAAAAKKPVATKKPASSKGSTEDESPDANLPKKQAAKKGKRGKTTVFDSSSEESDLEVISAKKPAAAKGKTLKVRGENTIAKQYVSLRRCVALARVWLHKDLGKPVQKVSIIITRLRNNEEL